LQGRRALVCGASRGIGAAIAVELAGAGAAVTGAARDTTRLESLVADIRAAGGTADHLTIDLERLDEAEETVAAHVRATGPMHILILNTGGPAPGPILEGEESAFLAGFTAHLLAAHRLVRVVLPGMREAGYGRIINIISTSVKQPIPNLGVSNTIRGAVASWAKTLAGEVGRFGVTVNNVLPGFTDTERLRTLSESVAAQRGVDVDEVVASWRAMVPVGRIGRPEEVAAAVAFLASPAAAYIHGINLPVDGGRLQAL
jgi:3-oxoacyl-[acyl-carrier protein] reductase